MNKRNKMKEKDKEIIEDILDILKDVVTITISFKGNFLSRINRVKRKLRKL